MEKNGIYKVVVHYLFSIIRHLIYINTQNRALKIHICLHRISHVDMQQNVLKRKKKTLMKTLKTFTLFNMFINIVKNTICELQYTFGALIGIHLQQCIIN